MIDITRVFFRGTKILSYSVACRTGKMRCIFKLTSYVHLIRRARYTAIIISLMMRSSQCYARTLLAKNCVSWDYIEGQRYRYFLNSFMAHLRRIGEINVPSQISDSLSWLSISRVFFAVEIQVRVTFIQVQVVHCAHMSSTLVLVL